MDPELVDRAVEHGFAARIAPQDLAQSFGAEAFDLICCFDVLEHLEQQEIIVMLSAFAKLLRADGRVIARFPSGDSPFSFAMFNSDITHRTHIGRGAVFQFCIASGLTAAQIRHPVMPIRGLGLRRAIRRMMVCAGRWAVRNFVRKIFFDNAPRVVDPNMLIVLQLA
ncbi:MAG: methyltransferase domain-containing protein [Pseudomonadota bacterium]